MLSALLFIHVFVWTCMQTRSDVVGLATVGFVNILNTSKHQRLLKIFQAHFHSSFEEINKLLYSGVILRLFF